MVWEIKDLVGETPLIFDREFSAQRWLKALEEAGCEWVVRLNTKSKVKLKWSSPVSTDTFTLRNAHLF